MCFLIKTNSSGGKGGGARSDFLSVNRLTPPPMKIRLLTVTKAPTLWLASQKSQSASSGVSSPCSAAVIQP